MDSSGDAGDDLRHAARRRRRRRAVALAIGLVLLVIALAATLSHAAKRRTGTNELPVQAAFATAGPGDKICQNGERIPAGTGAIRVTLAGEGNVSPRLSVALSERGIAFASGSTGAGPDGAGWVRIPLAHPLRGDVAGSVCISVLPGGSPSAQYRLTGVLSGQSGGAQVDGAPAPGRLRLEFLPAGDGSWWSFAPTVARRIGLGHAWSGPTVALLALALTLTSIAVGAWQVVRGGD